MNKTGEPVINDPRDALLVNPCEVKYFQSKGMAATADNWRPLWRNHNIPYQFDKKYLQTIEHARMHATDRQYARRGLQSPAPHSATGFGHTAHLFTDHPEGSDRYAPVLSRSVSSPAMRTFSRKAHGDTNSSFHLTGGIGAGKNILGSSQGHGMLPAKGAHLPGYRGHVPGLHTEHLALSTAFGKATNALGRLRDGVEGTPLPAPFIPY
eukprot:gb/GFBE01007051.1/.p1 GENE.gb/GFBE01007051.1/~~gb/GFBE01007051.1/.p1  ORF type:complete len:209 (+),score=14.17 gb/GFBE01007051.1/:1-627(+)